VTGLTRAERASARARSAPASGAAMSTLARGLESSNRPNHEFGRLQGQRPEIPQPREQRVGACRAEAKRRRERRPGLRLVRFCAPTGSDTINRFSFDYGIPPGLGAPRTHSGLRPSNGLPELRGLQGREQTRFCMHPSGQFQTFESTAVIRKLGRGIALKSWAVEQRCDYKGVKDLKGLSNSVRWRGAQRTCSASVLSTRGAAPKAFGVRSILASDTAVRKYPCDLGFHRLQRLTGISRAELYLAAANLGPE
jgi:hypothetical protein